MTRTDDYPEDDGPLTEEHLAAIEELVRARLGDADVIESILPGGKRA